MSCWGSLIPLIPFKDILTESVVPKFWARYRFDIWNSFEAFRRINMKQADFQMCQSPWLAWKLVELVGPKLGELEPKFTKFMDEVFLQHDASTSTPQTGK